jgi:hypothetical protein
MSGGQRRTIRMTSGVVKDKERLGIAIRMTSGIVKDKDRQGIAIWTKSRIAKDCYNHVRPYLFSLISLDLRPRCLVLYLLSLTHGLTAALPCTYIRYALDPVSFPGYLCFTYRLRAGPKPSFPFVYKLVDYYVVLYFNLTWFYLKPSRFS